MKLKNKMLFVYKNTTDYSNVAYKIGIEEVAMTLATTDVLYIGYYKPVKNLFIELKTANTNASVLSTQIFNGTSFVDCFNIDETKGLKKSNFVYLSDDAYNNKETTINGVSAFWIKLTVSANTSAMITNGISCLFCCEDDLRAEEPALLNFYPRGLNSHILSMTAARDFILRKINNSGFYKYQTINALIPTDTTFIYAEDFVPFDIFDIDEIRDCATFYSLHKIFSNRSDEKDDMYSQKAQEYLDKFNEVFKLWNGRKLTIDMNKDGKKDIVEENLSISKGSFSR
jgi:hypothetical protein